MIDNDIIVLQKIVERCNKCKFAACEQCEINYTEVESIKRILRKMENQEHIIEGKDCVIETQSNNEEVLLNQLNKMSKNGQILDLVLDFLYNTWKEYPNTIAYALSKYAFDVDIKCADCKNKKCKDCLKQFFEEKIDNIKENKNA